MERVLGCNQSKWPWHSFVCSVAPEDDQLPLMLSCWCSVDLLMIFFFVSPLYTRTLTRMNILVRTLQGTFHIAYTFAEVLTLNLAPETYRRCADDTHARFSSREQSREFQNLLNKQDRHIQFTIEDESEEKCLNFLDIKVKNGNRRCEFDVHLKPALTNVQIKPHSCISLDAITSVFKGFLARATNICSERCLREEIECLPDIFCENGHDRKT